MLVEARQWQPPHLLSTKARLHQRDIFKDYDYNGNSVTQLGKEKPLTFGSVCDMTLF